MAVNRLQHITVTLRKVETQQTHFGNECLAETLSERGRFRHCMQGAVLFSAVPTKTPARAPGTYCDFTKNL